VHPSEFGRVGATVLPAPWARPSWRLATALLVVVGAGATLLVNDHAARLPSERLGIHRASRETALPDPVRLVAGDAALVHAGPHTVHGWLVTATLLITPPVGAASRARATSLTQPVTLATRVTTDAATHLVVWRLARPWVATALDRLPYDVPITAVATTASDSSLAVTWASTPLGDPVTVTTRSLTVMGDHVDPALHAPLGTLGVDRTGHVVAFLAAPGRWLDARALARAATVDTHNGGCHLRWELTGRDAPAGGVLVVHAPAGSSLRPGDVVTRFDGQAVSDLPALRTALYLAPAGERSTWTRDRAGVVRPDGTRLPCRL
jgi:hypothetical protein